MTRWPVPRRSGLAALVWRLPTLGLVTGLLSAGLAHAADTVPPVVEPRQRLDIRPPGHARDIALTLDACGGDVDRTLVATLVRLQIPATVFVTRRWLDRQPAALAELRAHPDLFEFENHGAEHVPAVLGQKLYGMKGPADAAGIDREIAGGSAAVERATGQRTRWYRGAGAAYDRTGLDAVARQGHQVAGFSLNGDDGATASAATVAGRLRKAQPGDIVLVHMNKPASGTAAGLASALPDLMARGFRFVKLSQAAGVVPTDRKGAAP